VGAIGLASEIYERAAKDAQNYWDRSHAVRHGALAGGQAEGQLDQVVRIYIPHNGRDAIPEAQLATLEDDSEELGDGG
jgi:hypothetical protein